MTAEEIIKQRMPVWNALSGIFLYPDLSESDVLTENIVQGCKHSKYSITLLEKIYAYEVMPTLYKYVSGWDDPWTGFDSEWLRKMILQYRKGKLVDENFRPTFLQKMRSRYCTTSSKKDWELIKSLIKESSSE